METRRRRLLTKCLMFIFKMFLFDPFDNRSVFENKPLLVYIVLSTLILVTAIAGTWSVPIMSDSDPIESVVAIGYGAAAVMGVINYHLLLWYKNKVANLMANVERGLYRYESESSTEITYAGLCREENMKRLTVFLVALFYGNAILATATSFYCRLIRNDLNALNYPSWFPWSTIDFCGYLLSEFVQLICSCYVCALTLGNIVYIALICLEYSRQYNRLRIAITDIPMRAAIATEFACSKMTDRTRKCEIYQKKFAENLIECIDHHRALRM